MNDSTPPMTSSKPYLVRAIYEWILDNGMTPHLVVDTQYPNAELPRELGEDGRIVFNISPNAVRELVIGNDWVRFSARFGGVARDVAVPTDAVLGILARENQQGMAFPEPTYPTEESDTGSPRAVNGGKRESTQEPGAPKTRTGPTLKVVK